MTRARNSRRGMTLIELMVVVAILCMVLGVLSVGVMSSYSSALDSTYGPLEVPPPTLSGGRIAPVVEQVDLDVELRSHPVLDGWSVGTSYDVEVDGTFVVRNLAEDTPDVHLGFAFPQGVGDLREVHLDVRDAQGHAPEGRVAYGLQGLSWTGPMATGDVLTVHLAYTAAGRDTLSLALWDGRRPVKLRARVALPGAPDVRVPQDALSPTSTTPDALVWEIDGLLSDAPVTVELPASSSALGHIALVGRLAALGVLLFGAGFWYLSEGVRPGRLDDFRLGGLLLLGLDYGLFYGIFLVVAPQSGAVPSALAAAVVSLPLLTLHVARITDGAFAVTRSLPLAIGSIGAVLGLAYADGSRAGVALAVLVAVTTLVTATWRRWTAGRIAWVEGVAEARRDAVRAEVEREAHAVLAVAERALQEAPDGLGPERAEVQRRAARLRGSMRRGAEELPLATLVAATRALEDAGARAVEDLYGSVGRLDAALDAAALVEVEVRGSVGHAPERLRGEVDAHLAELLALRSEAASLSKRVATSDGRDLRAQAAEARRLARATEGATARLVAGASTVEEAARLTGEVETAVHCPACGAAHGPSSRFCQSCGLARPVECPCSACGHVNRLPAHLLRADWRESELHCGSCGAGVPS